jgi:ankyrin repeat protein
MQGFDRIIAILLKHGASVDLKTSQDKSALDIAINEGKLDAVKILIENGAYPARMSKYYQSGFNPTYKKEFIEGVKNIVNYLQSKNINLIYY